MTIPLQLLKDLKGMLISYFLFTKLALKNLFSAYGRFGPACQLPSLQTIAGGGERARMAL